MRRKEAGPVACGSSRPPPHERRRFASVPRSPAIRLRRARRGGTRTTDADRSDRLSLQRARVLAFDESFGALDPVTLVHDVARVLREPGAIIAIAHRGRALDRAPIVPWLCHRKPSATVEAAGRHRRRSARLWARGPIRASEATLHVPERTASGTLTIGRQALETHCRSAKLGKNGPRDRPEFRGSVSSTTPPIALSVVEDPTNGAAVLIVEPGHDPSNVRNASASTLPSVRPGAHHGGMGHGGIARHRMPRHAWQRAVRAVLRRPMNHRHPGLRAPQKPSIDVGMP